MTDHAIASFHEDLSAEPVQAAIRDRLRDLVDGGHSPGDVAEAALVIASALCLDVEGIERAAMRLLTAGTALANASPRITGAANGRRSH